MSDKKISELPIASTVNPDDVSILVSNGTDYQFAFTTLLQLVGSSLTVGANISFGITLPQNNTGKNGDVFVNTDAGSFAKKISGTWTVVYTLPSSDSLTDGTVLYGLGVPGNSTGNNNDTYINTGTGIFYKKSAGTWSQVFSMQTGPQGPQGTAGINGTNGTNGFSVLNGSSNPSNSSTGTNGDFYINTTNYTLFGPKTAGDWGSGVPLVGIGIAPGGATGEALVKNSNDDYDTEWLDLEMLYVQLSGSYANPSWINSLAWSKLTSVPSFESAITAGDVTQYWRGDKTWQTLLDGGGKIISGLLPSYVDDVLEFANFVALPGTGEMGKIYVTLDTNFEYRWSGSVYIRIVASPGTTDALAEGSTNLYYTNARVASYGNTIYPQLTGSYTNPAWITSLGYSKLTGAPTDLSSFTNGPGYLTSAYTGFDTRYLPLAGGTLTSALTIGTSADITGAPVGSIFNSLYDNAATSGVILANMFRQNYTAAWTSGTNQGLENYMKLTGGDKQLAIGLISNMEWGGTTGTGSDLQIVRSGLAFSSGGTTDITNLFNFYSAAASNIGGTASGLTIGTAIQYYAGTYTSTGVAYGTKNSFYGDVGAGGLFVNDDSSFGGNLTVTGNLSAPNIATIVASNYLTAQTTLGNIITYTVGGSDAAFQINGIITISAIGTGSISVTVDWTDDTNTARSQPCIVNFGSATVGRSANVNGLNSIPQLTETIYCKAATTITVRTSGSAAGMTFNAYASILNMP